MTRTTDDPPPATVWGERRERWLRTRGAWAKWWANAAVTAGESISDVRAIWTIMPPYGSAAVGRAPGGSTCRGLPTLASVGIRRNDDVPNCRSSRRGAPRDRPRTSIAAAVVMSTPEAVARVSSFRSSATDQWLRYRDGYDESDFAPPLPPPSGGGYRVVHRVPAHRTRIDDGVAQLPNVYFAVRLQVSICWVDDFFLVQAVEASSRQDQRSPPGSRSCSQASSPTPTRRQLSD